MQETALQAAAEATAIEIYLHPSQMPPTQAEPTQAPPVLIQPQTSPEVSEIQVEGVAPCRDLPKNLNRDKQAPD